MAKLTRISPTVANLGPQDVGALPVAGTAVNSAKLENKTKAQIIVEARTGYVPETRTVNSIPLSANVVLTPANIGSAPAVHSHAYIPLSEKNRPNGIPTLDAKGKVLSSQLPPLSLKQSHVAQNESEMLALDAEPGDLCIRIDTNKTLVLIQAPSTVLSNWQSILSPTDSVQSFNGLRGVVVVDAADLGGEMAFNKNSAFNKNFGTSASTVAAGNDPRIVNAVPNNRTINNKPLTTNLTLSATDVGALGATATATNSYKLEGKTKAQVIAEARAGLASTGTSYTKAESDGRYQRKDLMGAALRDLIRTVDIQVVSTSSSVSLPNDSVSTILVMAISGALQTSEAYTLSGKTVTFAEPLEKDDIVTIIGFK